MPWLGFPAPSATDAGAARRPGVTGRRPGDEAERFFRRMVGDAAWDRLPDEARADRRADGPALVADLRGHARRRRPSTSTALGRAGGLRPGRARPARAHHRQTVAWLATTCPGPSSSRSRGPATAPTSRTPTPSPACAGRRRRWAPRASDGGTRRRGGPGPVRVLAERLARTGGPRPGRHAGLGRPHRGPACCADPARHRPAAGCRRGTPPAGTVDAAALAAAGPYDAVVHLAGAGIGDRRWTAARQPRDPPQPGRRHRACWPAPWPASTPRPAVLGQRLGRRLLRRPRRRGARPRSPARAPGSWPRSARAWEAAAAPGAEAGIRVVRLRTRHRARRRGGALARQLPLFRLGLGGRLGGGRQYVSWITLADEVAVDPCGRWRMPAWSGRSTLCAPGPVTNAEFTRALGRALHRPAALRRPPAGAGGGLSGPRLAGELLCASQRVLSRPGSRPPATASPTPSSTARWRPCWRPGLSRSGYPARQPRSGPCRGVGTPPPAWVGPWLAAGLVRRWSPWPGTRRPPAAAAQDWPPSCW